MSNKHYYVEDITQLHVESKKPTDPRHSIQFDLLTNTIYINIDELHDKKLVRAAVQIFKEELVNACKWFELL